MSDFTTYHNWISPGFSWLDDNWPEDQGWEEVKHQFLEHLGVAEQDLHTPECRVLGILVEHVENLAEDERRPTLLSPPDREVLLNSAFVQWQQEGGGAPAQPAYGDAAAAGGYAGSAAAAQDPEEALAAQADAADRAGGAAEMQYFEGHGWMRVDPATNTWVPADSSAAPEAPAAAAAETPGAAAPDAGAAAAAEAAGQDAPAAGAPEAAAAPAAEAAAPDAAAPAAPPAPEDVAQRAADDIALPALTSLIEAVPEAASLSAEELSAMIAELLAERVAAGPA